MKDLKIEVPELEGMSWNGDANYFRLPTEVALKWKAQCERVNALLEKATVEFSSGRAMGIFIPLPEEPDSAEKLIEDLASYYSPGTPPSGIFGLIDRARKLKEKREGK